MEFAFPWPVSQGEWLAFTGAALTIAVGLVMLLAPALALRLFGQTPRNGQRDSLSEVRSTMAGFHLGIGIASLLFAQPLLYLALGLCWLLAALGRLVSILADGAGTPGNWLLALLQIVVALLPLSFAFGFVY